MFLLILTTLISAVAVTVTTVSGANGNKTSPFKRSNKLNCVKRINTYRERVEGQSVGPHGVFIVAEVVYEDTNKASFLTMFWLKVKLFNFEGGT